MLSVFHPLACKNGNEKRRHHKLNALCTDSEHAAQQPAQNKAPKEKKERTVTAEAAQKKNQKQLEKQIAKLEREIEKQEAKLEALEPQIQEAAADYTRLSELLEQQTETQAQLDEMYAQWEQLSSDLEA